MQIHKDHFLTYCVNSAATLGLPMTVLDKLEQALAVEGFEIPKVIWLNGANCTGCTVYWANLFNETGRTFNSDLLFNTIDMDFSPDLMAALQGLDANRFLDSSQGSYILAVDGDIPTTFDGHTCLLSTDQGEEVTAIGALRMLAPGAAAVLAIGNCASFGGTFSGDSNSNSNSNGTASVSQLTGVPTVNIPGCPTHPDWIVWTIAHLLSGETLQLDDNNRPVELFGTPVQKWCPWAEHGESPGNARLAPDPSSGYFQFTKVVWDDQTARLKIAGEGIADKIVSIYNADSGALLGAVPVNKSGRWKLCYNEPSPIPLRLLAKSGDGTAFSEVSTTAGMSN
jgi:hydrogenase small subunit